MHSFTLHRLMKECHRPAQYHARDNGDGGVSTLGKHVTWSDQQNLCQVKNSMQKINCSPVPWDLKGE